MNYWDKSFIASKRDVFKILNHSCHLQKYVYWDQVEDIFYSKLDSRIPYAILWGSRNRAVPGAFFQDKACCFMRSVKLGPTRIELNALLP